MTLKTLGIESLQQIMTFDKLCFPGDFWKEDDWVDLLGDDRAVYYALLENGEIIADVFVYNWCEEKDYIKIMNIAVHPLYRNQGLAKRLLNHVTETCAKSGMKRFCGETRASNSGMRKVFENCGYQLRTIEENYYDIPKESAFKYVLQL